MGISLSLVWCPKYDAIGSEAVLCASPCEDFIVRPVDPIIWIEANHRPFEQGLNVFEAKTN